MPYKPKRRTVWLVVAHGVIAIVLAARLPADGWYVSDPGARLAAAGAVVDHPARPFELGLPGVPLALAAELPQPYFAAHGDHAHAIAPPLFPVLVAPFLAMFGLYGSFVVPIASWIAIGPLTATLARQLGADVKPWVVILASIVATPFVFYGLEFWDHAPAVACLLGGIVLALSDRGGASAGAAGGGLMALSTQLRPEMAPAVVAALVVLALRRAPRVLAAALAGAVVAASPFVVYNLVHFGQLSSPHVAINLALVGEHWWAERLHDAHAWFGTTNPLSITGFALIGLGWLAAIKPRFRLPSAHLAILGAMIVSLESMLGHEPHQAFFGAFPLGLLALMPIVSWTHATRDLVTLALVPLLGCWLTAPNDGGGQWGSRYLLAAVPPMVVLGLQNLSYAVRERRALIYAGGFMLLVALLVSRTGYQELRGAKRYYSRLAAATAGHMGDAHHLVTDAWWVPAAHAAVIDYRKTVVIRTPAEAARVLSTFDAKDVLAITDNPATSLAGWTDGTCYRAGDEQKSADGRLRYARLSCR